MTDDLIERTRKSRFQKGKSGNPGGFRGKARELREIAQKHMPKAMERARQILNDNTLDWKAWLDAARFLAPYAMGSPRPLDEPDSTGTAPEVERLTREQLEAIASTKLSTELPDDAPSDTEH